MSGVNRASRGLSLLDRVGERASLLDAVFLTTPVAAILAVYTLPVAVRRAYVLDYTDPTLATMFASHFVHLDAGHLLANLAGYALVVPLAYLLSLLGDRRRLFYVSFAVFLLAYPFVLSALNVALSRPHLGYGFSGINMAFLGFVPIALAGYLSTQFPGNVGLEHSPILFFLDMAVISVVAVPVTTASVAAFVLAVAAMAIYLRALLADLPKPDTRRRWLTSRSRAADLAAVSLGVFVLFPLAAFPTDPSGVDSVLNVFVHLLGYALGYISSYVTATLLLQSVPGASLPFAE